MNKIADIPIGGFSLPGGFDESDPAGAIAKIISTAIGILSIVASIWFVFKIIGGGIAIMSAGGDQGKLAEARQSITNGLIGLLVTLLGIIFVAFIGSFFGLNILNLREAFGNLTSL